ncbi:signal peptidase I [Candidatus Izimaplasma bacterium]|nr:signal peptidase I [Candidatus Izimaplasma bacterium]
MKTINSIIYYIIVILLVSYILIVSISPDGMMKLIGYGTFIVLSDSMEPEINVHDLIVSKETTENDLEVGDIITFRIYIVEYDTELYVTHYIGDIVTIDNKSVYKTRGINLDEDQYDRWLDKNGDLIEITFDDIEGKYLFKIPYIGYVQKLFRDRQITSFVLVVSGLGYLIWRQFNKKEKVT